MQDDFEELQDAVMNDQVLIDWWVREGGVYDPDMERGVGPGHMPGLSLEDFIEDNYDDLRDYVDAKEMKAMKAQYDVERPGLDDDSDDSGYDKDDPKHTGYAERMAALADQERDRRKYGESATRASIDALFEALQRKQGDYVPYIDRLILSRASKLGLKVSKRVLNHIADTIFSTNCGYSRGRMQTAYVDKCLDTYAQVGNRVLEMGFEKMYNYGVSKTKQDARAWGSILGAMESFGGYGNRGTGGVAGSTGGSHMGDPGAEVAHSQRRGDALHKEGTSNCCGSDIYLDGTCVECGKPCDALEAEDEMSNVPPGLRRRYEAGKKKHWTDGILGQPSREPNELLYMDVDIPGPAPHSVDAVRAALVRAHVPARNIFAIDSWERLDDESYEVAFYATPGTKALLGDL